MGTRLKRALASVLLLAGLSGKVPAQELAERPIISVLDFAAAGISESEVRTFTEALSSCIASTESFRIIDRRQRETILAELAYSYPDCADENCQLEIGRLLSASQLVVGSIGRIGEWLIVSARLMDVATGETLYSASEKYPSLTALLDGATWLAEQALGRAASEGVVPLEPADARQLINAAKEPELIEHWNRLRRRVRESGYTHWLAVNHFTEYERTAAVDEKIAFLEEYRYQTNSRGHAVDLAVSYGTRSNTDVIRFGDGSYDVEHDEFTWALTASWSFQFSSCFSTGVSLFFAPYRWHSVHYDSMGTPMYTSVGADWPHVWVGPLFIFGDKTDSIAVLVATGFGFFADLLIPLRCGLYYRNIYLGYSGYYGVLGDFFVHRLEAGYSLFFGKQRSFSAKAVPARK